MASFFRTAVDQLDTFLSNLTSTGNSSGSSNQTGPRHSHNSSTSGYNNSNRARSAFCNNRNCGSTPISPPHSHQFRTNQSRTSREGVTMSSSNNPNVNSNSTNSSIKGAERFDIQDVRDPNDINNLSAKQLKTILTVNCVDYKGIFEKEVLREKVLQLWIDHNEREGRRKAKRANPSNSHGSQDSSDDIDEKQVCKICWEREIDCVLLECGHMATCLICGKKCNDCPICRQNITRCVRTFKV